MLFEDNKGNLLTDEEIDELSPWEIEELGIHIFEEEIDELSPWEIEELGIHLYEEEV